MADISEEIAAFKNAVYGEDVRNALVALANKINTIGPSRMFGYVGRMVDGDDFNNYVNAGYYYIPDGISCSNSPKNTIGPGFLVVYHGSNSPCFQYYYDLIDGNTQCTGFTRRYTSSWSTWAAIGNTQYIGDYNDYTDYNQLVKPGIYYVGDSNTISNNCPNLTPIENACFVIVLKHRTTSPISQIFISHQGTICVRKFSSNSWSPWVINKHLISPLSYVGDYNDYTDLNTCLTPGYYYFGGLEDPTIYTNTPSNLDITGHPFMLLTILHDTGVPYTQILFSPDLGEIYMRRGYESYFRSWVKCGSNVFKTLKYVGNTTSLNSTDLNDFTETGFYYIPGGLSLSNLPSDLTESVTGYLITLTQNGSVPIFQYYMLYNGDRYNRRYTSFWGNWYKTTSDSDRKEYNYDHIRIWQNNNSEFVSLNTENTGQKISVMSYNICQFTNDTHYSSNTVWINDDQSQKLKEMLYDADADFIGLQEWRSPIETTPNQNPMAKFFYPKYSYLTSFNGVAIISKFDKHTSKSGSFTSGRHWVECEYAIGNKYLSIYSTHPYPGGASERHALRLQDWNEFKAILDADRADWIIATGDYNYNPNGYGTEVYDPDELDYFKTLFGSDYNMVNGGVLGWYETTGRYNPNFPCDNILYTKNVVLNKLHVYRDWYPYLYSDHVPILADFTLVNTTKH